MRNLLVGCYSWLSWPRTIGHIVRGLKPLSEVYNSTLMAIKIVEQLLWLICLLSTYPKLGCNHYYSDVAFLEPNKNFTIANSAGIWLSFSQVDTVLSKSGFKKFISPVHDLHVQEILFLKFNRYLFQVTKHIRKFTCIFLRRTLLTITFNQALIFFLILAKKTIFSSDAFLTMVSIYIYIYKGWIVV
jgi:hypothetical protein